MVIAQPLISRRRKLVFTWRLVQYFGGRTEQRGDVQLNPGSH